MTQRFALTNASLPTVPHAEGQLFTILVENGKIKKLLASRNADSFFKSYPVAQIINVKKRPVVPAFMDSHTHFLEYGLRLSRLDLEGKSYSESLALIRQKSQTATTFVLGGGWSKKYFGFFPTREALDDISTTQHILLSSHDAHSVWCNSKALSLLNLSSFPETQVPRDGSGNPSGILFEEACVAMMKQIVLSNAEKLLALKAAEQDFFRLGITETISVEDASALAAYKEADASLRIKMNIAILYEDVEAAATFFKTHSLNQTRLNSTKLFLDGSLGSETCFMLSPFEGSKNCGLDLLPSDALMSFVKFAERLGLPVAMHAIGDAAVRKALDTVEKIRSTSTSPLPHRIEHAQTISDDDVSRFAELGVTASMQPVHIKEDIAIAEKLLASRSKLLYRFQSLASSGATLIFGSDAPIETPNVLHGIFYAAERLDANGQAWHTAEALSRRDALKAYTETPHATCGDRATRGKIAEGFEADLVVLSDDLLACSAAELKHITPVLTLADGDVVFNNRFLS